MRRLAVAICLVTPVAFAQPVRAICLSVTLDTLLSEQSVAAIFRGTIVKLEAVRLPPPGPPVDPEGQIATFQVDRVWNAAALLRGAPGQPPTP